MYIKKLKESKKPTKLSQKKIDFGKKNKDDIIDEQDENGDYVDENYDDLILDEEFDDGTDDWNGKEESEEQQLQKFWRHLTTTEENSLVNQWYGAIWEEKSGK